MSEAPIESVEQIACGHEGCRSITFATTTHLTFVVTSAGSIEPETREDTVKQSGVWCVECGTYMVKPEWLIDMEVDELRAGS